MKKMQQKTVDKINNFFPNFRINWIIDFYSLDPKILLGEIDSGDIHHQWVDSLWINPDGKISCSISWYITNISLQEAKQLIRKRVLFKNFK